MIYDGLKDFLEVPRGVSECSRASPGCSPGIPGVLPGRLPSRPEWAISRDRGTQIISVRDVTTINGFLDSIFSLDFLSVVIPIRQDAPFSFRQS